MIFSIISFIVSCFGIYGFYNHNYTITYLGLALCIIEIIISSYANNNQNNATVVISGILGWIITKKFWLGISIGICFENVISSAIVIIMLLFAKFAKK